VRAGVAEPEPGARVLVEEVQELEEGEGA